MHHSFSKITFNNSKILHETAPCTKHLKGAKVTAWIAFNLRHGPHWFQDGRGKTMTVNGERCCEIINKFNTELGQMFTLHRRSRMWFQQDGATPHTAHDSFDLLKELFGSRVISFRTTHEWASHIALTSIPCTFGSGERLRERCTGMQRSQPPLTS